MSGSCASTGQTWRTVARGRGEKNRYLFKFVATCVSEKTREKIKGVFPIFSLSPPHPIKVTANVGETKMKQKRKMAPEPKNIFFSPVLPFSVLLLRFWKRGGGKSGEMEFLNFPSLSSLPFLLFFLRTRLLLRLTTVSRRPEPAVERCVQCERADGRTSNFPE